MEYQDLVQYIAEEVLAESNYSAADLVKRARKVLPDREKAVEDAFKRDEDNARDRAKKGLPPDYDGKESTLLKAEARRDHAKALASLPNPKTSGVSAKKLDRAAYNAAHTIYAKDSHLYKRIGKMNHAVDVQRPYGDRQDDSAYGVKPNSYDNYKAGGGYKNEKD